MGEKRFGWGKCMSMMPDAKCPRRDSCMNFAVIRRTPTRKLHVESQIAQSLMGCSSSLPTTTVDLANAGKVEEGQRSSTRRSSARSSLRRSSLESRSSVFRKSRMSDVKQPMDLASEAYDRGKARFDKGDQEAALVEFMECQALVVAEQKRRRGTLEMKLVKARQSSRERGPSRERHISRGESARQLIGQTLGKASNDEETLGKDDEVVKLEKAMELAMKKDELAGSLEVTDYRNLDKYISICRAFKARDAALETLTSSRRSVGREDSEPSYHSSPHRKASVSKESKEAPPLAAPRRTTLPLSNEPSQKRRSSDASKYSFSEITSYLDGDRASNEDSLNKQIESIAAVAIQRAARARSKRVVPSPTQQEPPPPPPSRLPSLKHAGGGEWVWMPPPPVEVVDGCDRRRGSSAPSSRKGSLQEEPFVPPDVFVSYRICEMSGEAKLLRQQLADQSIRAFVAEEDVKVGRDMQKEIARALDEATLVVVLASETYGFSGTTAFATRNELNFVLGEGKPLYLIKSCERWDEAWVRLALGNHVLHCRWLPGEEIPSNVIEDIKAEVERLGGGDTAVPVGPPGEAEAPAAEPEASESSWRSWRSWLAGERV